MTWTLPQLTEACRSAPAVFLALLDLSRAGGSPVVTAGRVKIAAACGIDRLPTITAALRALEAAGWVQRVHKYTPARSATLLKVIISHPAYTNGKRSHKAARIRTKNARFHANEKCSQSFPSERGAHGSASAPPTGTPTCQNAETVVRGRMPWREVIDSAAHLDSISPAPCDTTKRQRH